MKKLISIVLVFSLLFSNMGLWSEEVTPTVPSIIALGDGVLVAPKTGASATKNNYIDNFGIAQGKKVINLSQEGMTSSALATSLIAPSENFSTQIKSADTIVISVGLSDLLDVWHKELSIACEIKPFIGAITATDLAKMEKYIADAYISKDLVKIEAIEMAINKTTEHMIAMPIDYKKAITNIVAGIKAINANSDIIIQTIYNPYIPTFTEKFYDTMENEVIALNNVIKQLSYSGDFRMADAYTAFAKSTAILTGASDISHSLSVYPNAAGNDVLATIFEGKFDIGTVIFSDTANHWAKDAIACVVKAKLFVGKTPTTFAPDDYITRGETITIMSRLMLIPDDHECKTTYKDVSPLFYYYSPIAWGEYDGIIPGSLVKDGNFSPNAKITREDLAVLMYQLGRRYVLPNIPKKSTLTFSDTALIAPYAKDSVAIMYGEGIILGKTTTTFDPKGLATRAEVSTMLQRYIKMREIFEAERLATDTVSFLQ